jgi:hypothetical protein
VTKKPREKTPAKARPNRVRSKLRGRSTTTTNGSGCPRQIAADAHKANVKHLAKVANDAIAASFGATANKAPLPALAFHFHLINYGYELHLFEDGNYSGARCRDFGEDHAIEDLKTKLIEAVSRAVENWRKKL